VKPTALEVMRQRLLHHPENQKVLRFLDIAPDTHWKLRFWRQDRRGPDEGGIIFFDDFGAGLPADTKVILLIQNLMVNPENGLIFGVHYGRCTFFIRCDLTQLGIVDSARLRTGMTLDGYVDIRQLGSPWAFLYHFCEDEEEAVASAYAYSFLC